MFITNTVILLLDLFFQYMEIYGAQQPTLKTRGNVIALKRNGRRPDLVLKECKGSSKLSTDE